ncbi:UDP:flavonoid glycosyltransferase YjiC (YdhE family), partial [Amycolatopsis bartoniae]
MRVLLMTYGSRGDVEPVVGLAVALRDLGAEVRVCAPPDFAELVEGAGARLTPVGKPIQALATGAATGKAPVTLSDLAADLTASAYDAVMTAAGCGVAAGEGGVAAAGRGVAADEGGVAVGEGGVAAAGRGVVADEGGVVADEGGVVADEGGVAAGEGGVAAGEGCAAAGEGCVAVLATGSLPAVAGAQAAAEKLGIRYAFASFTPSNLPSPHRRPAPWPGQVVPEGETDNLVLWKLQAEHLHKLLGEPINAHRVSVGLPPVSDIRSHVLTRRPFLAADPVLGPWQAAPELGTVQTEARVRSEERRLPGAGQEAAELGVVQTGAWIRPDDRPLPAELESFLAAGAAPVYVGFGSMLIRGTEAAEVSRTVVEAVRAQGRRVLLGSGWAGLTPVDDRDDCFTVGEVNQQELFRRVAAVVHHGGAGTTVTAARAGAPQVLVPQVADQP